MTVNDIARAIRNAAQLHGAVDYKLPNLTIFRILQQLLTYDKRFTVECLNETTIRVRRKPFPGELTTLDGTTIDLEKYNK